ncbi:MAG: hypothetical protein ACK58U_01115 [Rubrivivax sp.]
MNHAATTTRLPAFILAAVMTFGIMTGLDALAITGSSSEALLAQQGQLLVSCPAPSRQG